MSTLATILSSLALAVAPQPTSATPAPAAAKVTTPSKAVPNSVAAAAQPNPPEVAATAEPPPPPAPQRLALAEAPGLPLGLSVSEFMAGTSASEISVSEHGRRRFELNPSSMWEGVQSVTCDFIDNKLAAITVLYTTDALWLPQMSRSISERGQPSTWPALTGTTLYERKVVEESAAWLDDKSMLAYLREASSSGTRLMVALMTRDRFNTTVTSDLVPGAPRQLVTVGISSDIDASVKLQYTRAFSSHWAWLVSAEAINSSFFTQSWTFDGANFFDAARTSVSSPFAAISAGAQWFPLSGGAPKGFFLEAKLRLTALNTVNRDTATSTSTRGVDLYTGAYGRAGYNFVFANGFVFGASAGVSYAARNFTVLPNAALDVGWSF